MADRSENLLIRIKTEGADIATQQMHALKRGVDTNLAGAGAAHKSFSKLGDTFGKVGGVVQNLAGYVGVGGLAIGLKDAITNAQDLQGAQAQLGRSIHANVRRPSAEATKQMGEYADSMSVKGGFQAPENLQAMAQFTRVTGSQTKAMKDLSLATNVARGAHIDFSRASRVVLMAEAGRTTGLSRLGISMVKQTANVDALEASTGKHTKAQLANAKALDQAATKVEAMRLIQQKYVGSTAAFTHTSAGMMNTFRNAVDLLSEKVGLKLLPYVDKAITSLGKLVDGMIHGTGEGGKIAKVFGQIAAVLFKVGKFLIDNYKAVLLCIGVWKTFIAIGKIMEGVLAVQAAFKTAQNMRNAAAATKALSVAEGEATGTTTGFAAAFGTLDAEMDANPVGLVVIAIAALAVGFYELYKHCKTFREIVAAVWSGMKAFAGWIVGAAVHAFDFLKAHWKLFMLAFGLTGIVIDIVVTHFQTFKSIVGAIIDWLVGAVKWSVGAITTVWNTLTKILSGPFTFVWNKVIHPMLNWIVSGVRWMAGIVEKLLGKILGPIGKVAGFIGKVGGGAVHAFGSLTGIKLQAGGFAGGGMALVGERGPEVVNLPRGSYVQPNSSVIGGAGGGSIVLYNVLDGKILSKSVVRQGLMQQSRM